MKNSKLFYPFAIFTGTIIGVGLFGLPYVALQSGVFTVVALFVLIGALVVLIHLLFGEVVLRTPGVHRLPGYVNIYLGNKSKTAVLFTTIFGYFGALLAYLVIGGEFFWGLLSPSLAGEQWLYTSLFFGAGSLLIWRGTKSIAKVEFWFLGLFFVLLLFLGLKGGSQIDLNNFVLFNSKNIFLPYGVIIFSLWGLPVVPEVRELLQGNEGKIKNVFISGIILAALTYLSFIFIVLGISGGWTTSDALLGLREFLPNSIVNLGLFFGVITTFTSFLTLGLTLKKIFYYDYKKPKPVAWLLACGMPLLLYILGFDEFILIISLVGAVAMGTEGVLVFLMHQRAKRVGKRLNPEYEIRMPRGVAYILSGMLVVGILFEIIFSIS